ncbi:unnamed protein product [Leptidea sinapis]|uniref:Uncharacterized protein n=1 Tax=Leptidea sinapis TaxID=189913 RepID=A0A5E4R0A4_9NEOP|nr:unnamed protein product [Leptidea sinapis]
MRVTTLLRRWLRIRYVNSTKSTQGAQLPDEVIFYLTPKLPMRPGPTQLGLIRSFGKDTREQYERLQRSVKMLLMQFILAMKRTDRRFENTSNKREAEWKHESLLRVFETHNEESYRKLVELRNLMVNYDLVDVGLIEEYQEIEESVVVREEKNKDQSLSVSFGKETDIDNYIEVASLKSNTEKVVETCYVNVKTESFSIEEIDSKNNQTKCRNDTTTIIEKLKKD